MKKLILLLPMLALLFIPTGAGQEIGDVNNDGSIDISDVVSLFNCRDIPLDDGDFNCDNSIDISDVIYLFKNYDKFRSSVVFAKNFQLEPCWDKGYCYIVDADGNKFVALKKGATAPNIPGAKVVDAPLKTVVAGDSVLIDTGYITNDSNILNSIKGVMWANSVLPNYPELYEKYKNGEISNIGSDSNPKYDIISNLNPDLVFVMKWAYNEGTIEKFKELDINYARTGDYWENSFLGRSEWSKFYSSFYGKDSYIKSNDYFQNVWKKRNKLLRITRTAKDCPTVAYFCYYYGYCYVYGSQHYIPRWIINVRGDYTFTDLPGTDYQLIDKETFYERTINADVCILDGMGDDYTTKEKLLKLNPKFADYKSYKNGRFYVQKADYLKYESRDPAGVMEDYAKMIHPELFPDGDSNLKYFVKIEN